jgi:predicted DNA-binding transcriptional regulator AlpA
MWKLNNPMAKYISVYAYAKKHKIPFSTVWDRIKAGTLPHKREIIEKEVILIKEDEKFKK